MSSNPPDVSAPQSHVFRARDNGHGLEPIELDAWQQIVEHTLPLQPANAAVRLLVVTGTDTVCESVEALQLQTDSFGFLLTWDATDTQSLPALGHSYSPQTVAPSSSRNRKKSNVIDSRSQFLRRYLAHRHSWTPSTPLIAEALIRSGYSTTL